MICPKCGTKVGNDGMFCPECGTKLVAERPPVEAAPVPQPAENYVPKHAAAEPVRPAAPQIPVWDSVQRNEPASTAPAAPAAGKTCPNCGASGAEGIAFCGNCGYRFSAPKAPARPAPRKRYSASAKKPKIWVPIAAGVALVLVVALVIGILSIAGGPLVKIGAAAQKTMKSGNFTAEYAVEVDGEDIEGILYADIDVKNRTVSMYTIIENGSMDMTYGIYDGTMFYLADFGSFVTGDTQDIEDVLDEIFDAYEEAGSNDLGELLDQLDELVYDYAGEELSDYLDFEELEKCLVKFGKAANKEKWLKANAGFSKTRKSGETLYTFAPGIYDLLVATLPYFETAFEDSDLYEDLMDSLEDSEDYLDDEASVEYTIGVKSGYLSSISVVMDIDGTEVEISLKLYDVNKTKLEESELQDMLDEAESHS